MSEDEIIKGARKGMIVLQETYNQNISNFSKGNLNIKLNVQHRPRAADSLELDDLTAISVLTFTMFKWYDNSLLYLKEAISTVKEGMTFRDGATRQKIEKSLLTIFQDIQNYQNKLQTQTNSTVSKPQKSITYSTASGRHMDFDETSII